jgi:hypothetical protein
MCRLCPWHAEPAQNHTSHVTRHTPHVTRHTSHVTRHTSHVTRHTPHVTRHTSHATRHTSRGLRARSPGYWPRPRERTSDGPNKSKRVSGLDVEAITFKSSGPATSFRGTSCSARVIQSRFRLWFRGLTWPAAAAANVTI